MTPHEMRRISSLGRVLEDHRAALARALDRHERTAKAVTAALTREGHETVLIPVDDHLLSRSRRTPMDMIFNTYFGPASRSDQAFIAAITEYCAVPLIGGGSTCHFLGLSKPLSKRLFVEPGSQPRSSSWPQTARKRWRESKAPGMPFLGDL